MNNPESIYEERVSSSVSFPYRVFDQWYPGWVMWLHPISQRVYIRQKFQYEAHGPILGPFRTREEALKAVEP